MAVATLITELKRRKVFRVALVYAGASWALLQFADVVSAPLGLPAWFINAVLFLAAMGFPIALILAWVFDMTPDGVHRTESMGEVYEHPPLTARGILQMAAIVVLVFAVGLLYLDRLRLEEQTVAAEMRALATIEQDKTIAVLPFVDMSEAGDQQYFGDGISEELLDALVRVRGLKVAARTSSFSFHGKDVPVADIASALGVNYVLEGSVRRSGDTLRITAQLIDATTGFHLYSQSYQRQLADIFALQDELAGEIVQALLPSLKGQQLEGLVQQHTSNVEAYNLRMQGRYNFFRASPDSVQNAVRDIEQALELDPNYSAAWGDLSYAYGFSSFLTAGDPTPYMSRSAAASRRALEDDPGNVPALLLQALVLTLNEFDHAGAAEYYRRARASGTDITYWAYNLAWLHLGPLGRYEEAIAAQLEARRNDPLASMPLEALAVMYFNAGQREEAQAAALEVIAMPGLGANTVANVGSILVELGLRTEAAMFLEQLGPWSGRVEDPGAMGFRMAYLALIDDLAQVKQMQDVMLEQVERGEFASPIAIAKGFALLGDTERALDWLGHSVDMREPTMLSDGVMWGRRQPLIKDQPRFHAILRRMGVPEE